MADPTDLTLPLTPAKLGRSVGAIVERAFPSPRQEECMRVGEMERALTALCGEAVQLAYNDAGKEAERYRTEARQAAEDSGRRMRLIVQMQAALCGTPQTPEVLAALAAIDAEARRSPWIAEQISGQGGGRG